MVISGALLPDFLFDDFQDFEGNYPNFPDMKFGVGQVDYYKILGCIRDIHDPNSSKAIRSRTSEFTNSERHKLLKRFSTLER